MLAATERSNDPSQARAYFYGNLGDSVERRYSGFDSGFLGGGHDGFQGILGTNQTWQAAGFGNYIGGGLINGSGRMFSGAHSGGGGFTFLRKFSSNSAFNHAVIAQCMMAYLGYGVVRNIIDLYADFATEGIEITHPNVTVQNFYRAWAKKINLRDRIYSLFLNLFVSGNAFIHRRWADISDKEKRAMKRAKSSEVIGDNLIIKGRSTDTTIEGREKGFIDWFLKEKVTAAAPKKAVSPSEERLPTNEEKLIPWGYTFLNPLQMEPRGRRLRGDNYWVMAIDKKDTLDVARRMGMTSSFSKDLGTTEVNLPKEFISRVRSYTGRGASYAAEVRLQDDELSVVQAPGKWDWFEWAVPFVYPALRALSFKDCLRNMELRACESVINSISFLSLVILKRDLTLILTLSKD